MTIAPDSTAVGKTGKPIPPWIPPRIAVPCAYWVFEPTAPYLKTVAISCQPTLLLGVVTLTQGPVSAITLPPVTTPEEIVASNHSLTRLLLVVGPLLWEVLGLSGVVVATGPRELAHLAARVTGADGYSAVIALGEIAPQLAGR